MMHTADRASAPSHHDLFSGVFITSTADSEFSAHTAASGNCEYPADLSIF
jgi:hypothetical protein